MVAHRSRSYYASKQCTYTDASGRPVPAPRPLKAGAQDPQPSSSSGDPRSLNSSQYPSSSSNQFRIYPNNQATGYQNDGSDDDHKHTRKRFRNERGNPMPVDDLIIDGPISGVSMDRPTSIDLDPALTRELTNRKSFLPFIPPCINSWPNSFLHSLPSCPCRHSQTHLRCIPQSQSRSISPPARCLCTSSPAIKAAAHPHHSRPICRQTLCSRSSHTNV